MMAGSLVCSCGTPMRVYTPGGVRCPHCDFLCPHPRELCAPCDNLHKSDNHNASNAKNSGWPTGKPKPDKDWNT